MKLSDILTCARGGKPADLLLANARIVNVFSGDVTTGNIAVIGDRIAGIGDYEAIEVRDMGGRFIAPGFMDPHVHIESSMMSVSGFVNAVAPHGVTTVVADPHEIANVMGLPGIGYMLKSSEHQPMNVYLALSSCVPATDMETSGARIDSSDMLHLMSHDRIVALAEVMNYPGVVYGDPQVLAKIELARLYHKRIEGHAPGLSGKDLNAYLSTGVSSDHECTHLEEAREKLAAGMYIFIREGSQARNLQALLPLITDRTAHRLMWCTDDRDPHDLISRGHIDAIVRQAIAAGVDPVMAIQMATIHPASYFGFRHLGAIAPGRQADLVVFSDITNPQIEEVYFKGRQIADHGVMLPDIQVQEEFQTPPSINVRLESVDFSVPVAGSHVRVIEVIPDQITTRSIIMPVKASGQMAVADVSQGMLKIAVIERHKGSGRMFTGFVKGLGFKNGAVASSVAHDSHNIIVAGTTDEDMKAAVEAIVRVGGGLSVASSQKVVAVLSLPIAGLMSPAPVHRIRDQLDVLLTCARDIGSVLPNPFMALSFMALPVIPELKITDMGLVDVGQFKIVSLFV
jgi:adenine deaminase